MERIKIYKAKKGFTMFLIVFGSILFLIGFLLSFNSIKGSTNIDCHLIGFMVQGFFFIFLGYLSLRSGKYFIEWDESQMRYLLPSGKNIETIVFAEIENIRIELYEIHLEFEDNEKTLNLENLQFEQIKSLKQKFAEIKATTEKANLVN
jgi:hypothetical protein